MGKMFKRKSVLYTWCLSYGLLLLMMVVMCIMLGRNARNQLISEYKSITQTLQKQSNNAINDYFDELERCAYEISNDYLVNDFVSTPDPSGSKYYNLQPIQQSLSVYALQSGGEVSRYLYMDNIAGLFPVTPFSGCMNFMLRWGWKPPCLPGISPHFCRTIITTSCMCLKQVENQKH